jgi:hypothetical protein
MEVILFHSEFGLINKQTGEIFDAELRIKRKGGKFMKIWQDTQLSSKIDTLQGNSVKILIKLLEVAGYNNEIPGSTELSRKLNKSQSLVARSYSELMKAGLVIKINNRYILNPLFCWKGTDAQYDYTCKQLMASEEKQVYITDGKI